MDQRCSEANSGSLEKDVSNCDESGLFWCLLPDRTLAFKSDKCSGGKKSKERVTFLLCTNKDGSQKMPVFAIGRFAQPRSFRGAKTIPVVFLSCPLVKKHADLSGSFLYSQPTMKDMYSKPTNRNELSIPMKTKCLA